MTLKDLHTRAKADKGFSTSGWVWPPFLLRNEAAREAGRGVKGQRRSGGRACVGPQVIGGVCDESAWSERTRKGGRLEKGKSLDEQ